MKRHTEKRAKSIPVAIDEGNRLVHLREQGHRRGQSPHPPFWCPICLERVDLRLGQLGVPRRDTKADNFRHQTNQDCRATSAEGHAHLEAKWHLHKVLEALSPAQRTALSVRVQCGRLGGAVGQTVLGACVEVGDARFPTWSRPKVEKYADRAERRADIMLLDADGGDVLAIEVVDTNDVDQRKAAELFAADVAWVEVDVAGDGLARVLSWTGDDSHFPASRTSVDLAWRCAAHDAVSAPMFMRLVDHYVADREPWMAERRFLRDVYWVERHWRHGEVEANSLWLRRWGGRDELVGRIEGRTGMDAVLRPRLDGEEARYPYSTSHDASDWINLEHLPTEERRRIIASAHADEGSFPPRRTWDKRSKAFVQAKPKVLWSVKHVVYALLYRLQGNNKPWNEQPRDPYEVPVIPEGLRAAWLADALFEVLEGHFSGERPIAGVPPMTKEEFLALASGQGTPTPASGPTQTIRHGSTG